MGSVELVVRGELAHHPLAERFAAEVRRVHGRYAAEVVARHGLCPFLRDVDTGFGQFVVLLDREPDTAAALAAALEAESAIVHLVFPCVRTPPPRFERFAARFGEELRKAARPAPVQAVFHPEMSGDVTSSHRLVGVLRRAPDPFVQLIPAGLSEGGTVLAGECVQPKPDPAEETFARVRGARVAEIQAQIAEIHADRDASYAPFLEAMGLARPGPRFVDEGADWPRRLVGADENV